MRNRARRRNLIALTSFAYYRGPGRREDPNGDTGNANAGGGGGTGSGSGQGGNNGSGQQGGQSGGQGGSNGGGQNDPQTVEQLPGWAQRVISDLRRENAAKRTSGSNDNGQGQQGGQNGAQQAQTGNTAAKDDDATQAAQAAARDSVLQLAAYRAAAKNGADPDLLLDSRTFVDEKLKKLDPTADDFSTKLTAAIKKAVEDNPKLKAVQAAGRSGGEFTGRPGGAADKEPTTPGERLRRGYAANQT